ncbi:Eukaryotic membrane protein family [Novymonas esmeraldas]|uniref:Eukaryotic membrane protein family n=1 Tax=Novymonas esmeraldas TaxID=1808958 RepID=A0AAW0EM47_9TRYP
MTWDWSLVRQQMAERLLGASAARRHHHAQHRLAQHAHEAAMAAPAGEWRCADSATVSLTAALRDGRRRDHGYSATRKHFERIPEMLVDLEFYFAVTGLGLFDTLVGTLLLPLKVLLPWRVCELRDVVALAVLAVTLGSYGVAGLVTTQLYSYLYHAVRRTSIIKLVMIFSILDVVDKVLSSLSQDSLEVLYATVDDVHAYYRTEQRSSSRRAAPEAAEKAGGDAASAAPARPPSWWLLLGSALVACVSTSCHSLSLLLHVVTLNVAINAEGNALLALLVGNNFAELKSVVFKKNTPESLHSVCALDALERLQYVLFFFVMLLHHMHEHFSDFAVADVFVMLCVEVAIDFTKHLFVSRFNGIPPSVFRAYSQLSLLDLSCEMVLWRVPSLVVVTSGAAAHAPTEDVAELLAPACGFAPKNVKRAGFDVIAYAALLLWSGGRFAGYLLLQAPLVCLLLVLLLAVVKLMLSSIIYGVCSRFTLRTLVVSPPSWPPMHGAIPAVAHSGGGGPHPRRSASASAATCAHLTASGVRLGVSPISSPRATPIGGHRRSRSSAAQSPTSAAAGGTAATRTHVRLTPLLLSLLKVDRFDLQAGKAKRSY